MANNPTLLSMPLAQNGQKNTIPTTQATAGDGLFSQSTGFPSETSLPLGAGGVAPSREDFNGVFNLLSAQNFMIQKGWVFQYDATQDYYAGCIVRDADDGKLYECIADMTAGTIAPHSDTANDYWKEYGIDTSTLADTDLANLTSAGNQKIIDLNTPDYTNGTSWTYSTSNTEQTYTAPSNGFLAYKITSLASQAYILVNGTQVITFSSRGSAQGSNHDVTSGMIFIPNAATVVVRSYDGSPYTVLTFFPTKEAV